MRYVIIGNSAAGIGAAEAIRKKDASGEIVIISDERHHTYSRPLISYLLLGKTDERRMRYRGADFYKENDIKTLFGEIASKIDPQGKCVVLDGGKIVPYDRLLVATGSIPFVPPIAGLDSGRNKFEFMTLDDAAALRAAITKKSRVLIIGAGLIGLKCAEGIRGLVGAITVVDLADRVLPSILDHEAAEIMQARLEENGIAFRLNDSVTEFTENSAMLRSGDILPFDVVVLAVGVRPSVSLFADAGGKIGRGISVNERLETSIPDVYAAGDCTESVDCSSGETKIMALLPNAYMQGECAGLNMAGGDAVFDKAIPMNAIGFFGLHVVSAGTTAGEVYFERKGNNYKKLFYENNLLRGFIIIGDKLDDPPFFDKAGIYTSLVRERTPLDSIDFATVCKNPGLLAFSKSERREMLGKQGGDGR